MKPARKQRAFDRMEHLEDRLLWSVGQDANGWTVVTNASPNIIYVSPTGSDSNAGTSSLTPVKSFARAQALSTSGANEILLQAGQTYNDAFTNWTLSGASATSPFLVSYYGTGARPVIYSGHASAGFATPNYANTGVNVNYVDVIGLQFEANYRDPTLQTVDISNANTGGTTGFYFYANGGIILVEDCSFNYYRYNFDIEALAGSTTNLSPSITNITIRRTVSANAYAFSGGRSQGLYAFNVNGISILQSDFDHDGWNANAYLGATDIGYNHDMYFSSTCSNVDVENNIIAEASYAGVMARAGGTINNNLFIDNAVACSFGSADGADSTAGGVTGTLIGNTIVGDKASASISNSPLAFGQGFVIANTSLTGTVTVSGNLFTADTQNAKPAIQLTMATGTTNPGVTVGLNNVAITGNILNGWRVGIQTDGRFVPGGSGLYALNNLKISKNDIINSTTQEVRHDGSFSSAQESWSADRYYDTLIGNSKWVTLQSNAIAFATWVSTYDLGATTLTSLPYSDPTRTVATYDTTLGGTGTFTDFLAKASLVSITNYTPQYMATAAASYVQAGFFTVSSSAPTAVASPINVNLTSLGLTTYSFTVNITGGSVISKNAPSSGNLLITGPNGYNTTATYVSNSTSFVTSTDAGGYQHTAITYRITPPNGKWTAGLKQDGVYTVFMLANQIPDITGNYVPEGIMGTFTVDLTPPNSAVNAKSVTTSGNSYGFSVAYSDASGIDTSTIYSGQLQVNSTNGFSTYATLSSVTVTSATSVVANYTITPPGGNWTAATNGTYTITMPANSLYDLAGNPMASGALGSFVVQLSGVAASTGSIAGFVFNDADGNGLFGSRETAMVGVQVFIDLAGTGVYATGDPTTVTDSTGAYSFTGLPAGKYTLAETAPTGYGVTTPVAGTNAVTLTTGQAATAINFANQLGAVSLSGSGTTSTPTPTSTKSPTPTPTPTKPGKDKKHR